MSNTQPVAASLAEIKAALPKAKADFVLNCLERQLPMASVMSEAAATLEEECMALRAELEQMKSAKAMEEQQAKAMEEEPAAETEEEPAAKAKAKSGATPVAKSKSGAPKVSAKASFNAKIDEKMAAGMPRAKAVRAVILDNPALQQEMLEEANA